MGLPRLRQAVVVAADLDAATAAIERELGASEPFRDPGISHFGLANAVFAVGDTFVEVVSPIESGTAAGRQLDRLGGDGGYMCMFELADIDAVRQRVAAAGVRVVHDTTNDDIVDLHLHPKDVPGAIVALDVTSPPGSWRWGGPPWEGPQWSQRPPAPAGGDGLGLRGLTIEVRDPASTAALWASLLGVSASGEDVIALNDGRQHVRFVAGRGVERIVAVDIATAGGAGDVDIAGVTFRRTPKEDA